MIHQLWDRFDPLHRLFCNTDGSDGSGSYGGNYNDPAGFGAGGTRSDQTDQGPYSAASIGDAAGTTGAGSESDTGAAAASMAGGGTGGAGSETAASASLGAASGDSRFTPSSGYDPATMGDAAGTTNPSLAGGGGGGTTETAAQANNLSGSSLGQIANELAMQIRGLSPTGAMNLLGDAWNTLPGLAQQQITTALQGLGLTAPTPDLTLGNPNNLQPFGTSSLATHGVPVGGGPGSPFDVSGVNFSPAQYSSSQAAINTTPGQPTSSQSVDPTLFGSLGGPTPSGFNPNPLTGREFQTPTMHGVATDTVPLPTPDPRYVFRDPTPPNPNPSPIGEPSRQPWTDIGPSNISPGNTQSPYGTRVQQGSAVLPSLSQENPQNYDQFIKLAQSGTVPLSQLASMAQQQGISLSGNALNSLTGSSFGRGD